MSTRTLFLISIIVQAVILLLLAMGSSLLVQPVFGGALPWGNLLTAVLLTLFPTNFLMVQRTGIVPFVPLMVFRACVYLGLILGAGWLFVSYVLAGNWSTMFEGGRNQQLWTYYTYATAILPFAGYFLMKLLSNFFKK